MNKSMQDAVGQVSMELFGQALNNSFISEYDKIIHETRSQLMMKYYVKCVNKSNDK